LKIDGLIESIKRYVETRIELLKIEIQEDVAKAIAYGLIFLLIGTGMVLFIFFISLSIAMLLSEYIGFFGGFAIVAGFYLLLALIIFLFREKLIALVEENVSSGFKSRKE
jgi:hypothetical protein